MFVHLLCVYRLTADLIIRQNNQTDGPYIAIGTGEIAGFYQCSGSQFGQWVKDGVGTMYCYIEAAGYVSPIEDHLIVKNIKLKPDALSYVGESGCDFTVLCINSDVAKSTKLRSQNLDGFRTTRFPLFSLADWIHHHQLDKIEQDAGTDPSQLITIGSQFAFSISPRFVNVEQLLLDPVQYNDYKQRYIKLENARIEALNIYAPSAGCWKKFGIKRSAQM